MSNFGFLSDPRLRELAVTAEKLFATDADACASRMRTFAEWVVDRVLAASGCVRSRYARDQLAQLRHALPKLPPTIDIAFNDLRSLGNKATHEFGLSLADANRGIRLGWLIARWYERDYGTRAGEATPYETPPHGDAEARLQAAGRAREEAERERARAESEAAALARLLGRPQVTVDATLQQAWAALEPEAQGRLERFLEVFREDPEAVPLQPLQGADEKLQAAIAEADLWLVVVLPPRRDARMCLWAGPPAEATRWAAGKRVEVHPVLGSVQIFDVAEAVEAAGHAAEARYFRAWTDEDLLRLGLPVLLLPSVRAVADDADFQRLAPHLPLEAAEALALLEAADSVDEVLETLARPTPPAGLDPEDYEAALAHPASLQRFKVMAPDERFAQVLAGSFEAWRVYLHPDQRRLVRMRASGPVQVLGGAGTGKTVALLHRAAWLAESLVEGRVLVTTYTRNLALQLEKQLASLVGPEAMAKVEVLNLHRLARRLVDASEEGARPAEDDSLREAWRVAMRHDTQGLPPSFYEEEWATVVQAQGAQTRGDYLRARRKGRGMRLGGIQKQAIWRVFEAYRAALSSFGFEEWPDIVRRARGLIQATPPYRAVLCDEVQDLTAEDLRFVRALAPPDRDDLFLVGDAHQRIYGRPVSLRSCGIHVVGRSRRLRVNYRTTQRIRDLAVGVVEALEVDDLDEGVDTLLGYRSLRLGEAPNRRHCATADEERQHIADTLNTWLREEPPEALCVAARTRTLARAVRDALLAAGLPVSWVDPNEAEPGPGVRVSTFHRMKGLEFKRVILAHVHRGTVPLMGAVAFPDPLSRAAHEQRERCLLYVAATRARDHLVVCGHGKPSPFLPEA